MNFSTLVTILVILVSLAGAYFGVAYATGYAEDQLNRWSPQSLPAAEDKAEPEAEPIEATLTQVRWEDLNEVQKKRAFVWAVQEHGFEGTTWYVLHEPGLGDDVLPSEDVPLTHLRMEMMDRRPALESLENEFRHRFRTKFGTYDDQGWKRARVLLEDAAWAAAAPVYWDYIDSLPLKTFWEARRLDPLRGGLTDPSSPAWAVYWQTPEGARARFNVGVAALEAVQRHMAYAMYLAGEVTHQEALQVAAQLGGLELLDPDLETP